MLDKSKPLALVKLFKRRSPPIYSGNFKPLALVNLLKSREPQYTFIVLSLGKYPPKHTSSSLQSNIYAKSFFIFLLLFISFIIGSLSYPNPSILSSISYKNFNSSLVKSCPLCTLLSIVVKNCISYSFISTFCPSSIKLYPFKN